MTDLTGCFCEEMLNDVARSEGLSAVVARLFVLVSPQPSLGHAFQYSKTYQCIRIHFYLGIYVVVSALLS